MGLFQKLEKVKMVISEVAAKSYVGIIVLELWNHLKP